MDTKIDLGRLLELTSRTFAVAIPLLPAPPRDEVTVSYLLFRIADTFEDATHWPRAERIKALRDFADLVTNPNHDRARIAADQWLTQRPCEHAGYLELLAATPAVLDALESFATATRAAIVKHTLRTIEGMVGFVSRGDERGRLTLTDESDLRQYCYIVAGIVGELLTDLFVEAAPQLLSVRASLDAKARAFGEGLQLVNILKDSDDDARDGRVYIPANVPRERAFALARTDLEAATQYVLTAQRASAPRGIIAFIAFPVLLARATLERLESAGAGTKIDREMVFSLLTQMNVALDHNQPAIFS